MDDKYSWVNTHKGIVKYLSTKEDSQQELIELLKSIGGYFGSICASAFGVVSASDSGPNCAII